MAVTMDKPGPYAPASAILEIINRYRNRGLVFPVTGEVLGRAGISESLIPRTLQALQTLDLFGVDGNPTATMEGIRLAPEVEYKKRLEDWLKSAYAEVFAFVDPKTDDETRIRDAFRSYNPVGQQPRMVTLFQGLCAAAGLAPEKTASAPRQAPRPRSNPLQLSARSRSSTAPKSPPTKPNPTTNPISPGLPPALAGLLASLPPDGTGWTAPQRQRFLTTFTAVLDFCFPVVEPTDDDDSDEPADEAA
jgi:hypothetical protein